MSKFQPIAFYAKPTENYYSLLPFKFSRFTNNRILLTNMVGEYLLLEEDKFQKFVSKKLGKNESSYIDLRSKHF